MNARVEGEDIGFLRPGSIGCQCACVRWDALLECLLERVGGGGRHGRPLGGRERNKEVARGVN